jgi:hypothetical protein
MNFINKQISSVKPVNLNYVISSQTQNRYHWWTVVNTVMSLQVP